MFFRREALLVKGGNVPELGHIFRIGVLLSGREIFPGKDIRRVVESDVF